MMNTDGSAGVGAVDDQHVMSNADREAMIGRIATCFSGNREVAVRIDEIAFNRSGGKLTQYRRVVQAIIQQKSQQIQNHQQQQQQQQQQQAMMNPQGQPPMYMQPQQTPMGAMAVQQTPQPSYAMPASQLPPSMMTVKQESQIPSSNIQSRVPAQSFSVQQHQQQQIKQELMQSMMPQQQQQQQQQQHHLHQQQIKQELIQSSMQQQQQQQQQQSILQAQQMRAHHQQQQQQQQQQQSMPLLPQQYIQQQQAPALPPPSMTSAPQQQQQRLLPQHLQQVRQPSHLNQQQQQQQQDPSTNAPLPQNQPFTHSAAPTSSSSSSGSQDEILQQLLSSPNPTKQPATAAQTALQARLRTMNRSIRQTAPPAQQQQASPMAPGPDPMISTNNISSTAVSSPHPHLGMMQQAQVPSGTSGSSSITRYMMTQSPQNAVYRPPISPMTTLNYVNSPTVIPDEETQYLVKFFTERIQYIPRMIARCQQEGQLDRIAKCRQLHDQISAFLRNPVPEYLVGARRLKEHMDRMFSSISNPSANDPSTIASTGPPANARPMSNEIFEQCQRTITDYLGKDSALKYNIAKRFLEPLSEVLNGVPHKNIRLDTDVRQAMEVPSSSTSDDFVKLSHKIESEFAHLSMNTYSYELKPFNEKVSSISSVMKTKDSVNNDYELTCRLIELNMPIVPPLKMKLTIQYPNEPPEILSLTSTAMHVTPMKLENSDGNTFFESISRNFVYFLFKLPTQHTISDILDIWRTAIRNASFSHDDS